MKSGKLMLLAPVVGLLLVGCNPFADEGTKLIAALSGGEAVCAGTTCGGDGTGVADIEISSDGTKLCWDIQGLVGSVDDVTAMHIHSGARGDVGPVVAEFVSGNTGCLEASAAGITEFALRGIAKDPANFYVDVHSRRYPEGAVRGQLAETGDGR